jgi:DNA processing protein
MTGVQLSDGQRLAWLRLIRSDNVGPRTFRTLVNRYGGAEEALRALPDLARKAGRSIRIASREEAERELHQAGRLGIALVATGEADYPRALQAIDSAPPLLALRGGADALARPMVAVVGSRNASAAGLAFAERLSRGLGEVGFTIVSGLARGIDSRAHTASLSTGTVAVLAGGHTRVYPAENTTLLDRIVAEGGVAMSEMPLEWEPRGRDFPRRNRIVSGLAHGVVVVEAARKSGSLITARFALEQGREVFAVPGSPLDPRAQGTNDLIREGATLCGSVEHVTSVLAPLLAAPAFGSVQERSTSDLFVGLWDELDWPSGTAMIDGSDAGDAGREPPVERRDDATVIAGLLGPTPVSMDDLARQAGLPIRIVQQLLSEMEIVGRLERHAGNAVSWASGDPASRGRAG